MIDLLMEAKKHLFSGVMNNLNHLIDKNKNIGIMIETKNIEVIHDLTRMIEKMIDIIIEKIEKIIVKIDTKKRLTNIETSLTG